MSHSAAASAHHYHLNSRMHQPGQPDIGKGQLMYFENSTFITGPLINPLVFVYLSLLAF